MAVVHDRGRLPPAGFQGSPAGLHTADSYHCAVLDVCKKEKVGGNKKRKKGGERMDDQVETRHRGTEMKKTHLGIPNCRLRGRRRVVGIGM